MNEKDLYRENVGREPVTRFPDDPDWVYRGTKAEREELAEKVDPPIEQESLFESDHPPDGV